MTGVAAPVPAAYCRPMTGDQRQRQAGSRAIYLAMQALHLIFFIAGTFLVIAVSIRYAQTVASLESYGAPIDGDVRRGPYIAIAASLVTAVLGGSSFLLLRNGERWACWTSVLVWSVLWFPASINVSALLKWFAAPIIVTMVCIAGSVFATAAYFLMSPDRRRHGGGHHAPDL